MKLKISEIEKDDDIYPRQQVSHKTAESYAEALRAGATFPSVEVQRISIKNDDGTAEEKTICLDGWHRLESIREYNKWIEKQEKELSNVFGEGSEYSEISEVEAQHWKEGVLDKEINLIGLMMRSAELNVKHGIRLSSNDSRALLQRIAFLPDSLTFVWKDIAKKIGVTQKWVSECVSPILAAKRMSRDALMYRLKLLGWLQVEIAKSFSVSEGRMTQIFSKLTEVNLLKSDFYDKGKSIEEIAEYYHLDIPLTWAILLEGKPDDERMEQFDCTLHTFNVWNFSERDQRLGLQHKMNIPGQIAMNLLYWFTDPGDLIVDPMAGGGSTIDACLVMGRRCRAYDVEPVEGRKDILKNDILQGFPDKAKNCDLIFLDPPYGDMVHFKDNDKFYDFIREVANKSYEVIKPGGKVALVMSDRTKGEFDCFTGECYRIFKDVGFECIGRISCPGTTNSANASEVKSAKKNRKLLGRDRILFVFGK